ncbi:MAG: L-threonylcarbamoyladenylate synthase [Phycisphaeraceae bacterium]
MPDASPLIRTPTDAAVADAGEAIRRGKLVGMPTETVYGLAANALDDRAVARVFQAKARPSFDPLIVHVNDVEQAGRYADHWPAAAARLADALWPGPLTIVVHKRPATRADHPAGDLIGDVIGDLVTSGLPSVALRVPRHPVARALIDAAGVPIAAPSANRFGRISPTRPEHVVQVLGNAVAMVLDGGACETGVESTVVSCTDHREIRVLRLGGVSVERLEEVLGASVTVATAHSAKHGEDVRGKASPGMLEKHYAPATPLHVCDRVDAEQCELLRREGFARIGVLALTAAERMPKSAVAQRRILSEKGDLTEAAANLFAAMRELDNAELDMILAERMPQRDLGRAINDRLDRASRR